MSLFAYDSLEELAQKNLLIRLQWLCSIFIVCAKYFGRFRKPYKTLISRCHSGWKLGNFLKDESFRENSLWELDKESLKNISGTQDHRRMFTCSHESVEVSGGNKSPAGMRRAISLYGGFLTIYKVIYCGSHPGVFRDSQTHANPNECA